MKKQNIIIVLVLILAMLLLGYLYLNNSKIEQYPEFDVETKVGLEDLKSSEESTYVPDQVIDIQETPPEISVDTESENQDEDITQEGESANQMVMIRVPIFNAQGDIQMTLHKVPYTKSLLKEVYKKLFQSQSNPQTGYNGLAFNSVSIDSGIATLNLSGTWRPEGDMSGYYMRQAVNAAAFQYNSVNTIQVMLRGELFDWCIDDQSGGENGCPNTPRYWVDSK